MKISSFLYTTGSVIISISIGMMTTSLVGFIVFGAFCIVGAFLNNRFI